MTYGEGKGEWSTRVCRRAHGCGLWRSISEGRESFSRHVSFVVGDGSRILFWHDKWTGNFFFLISKKIILKNHKKTKTTRRVQRGEQKRTKE